MVFGHNAAGHVLFYVLQAATAAILFTGGNTSFTGFPFLASFVAEDSFLPRWLTRRGHRLVFSNGIIVLAALSLTLMIVAGATVDALIPFYAIGVFTGFAMAGFGMARYHRRNRVPGWRRRLAINAAGGTYTALVADTGVPLELADCPDRRLAHAAARLAAAEAATPGTHVTVVLPRRSYPVLASRLLHDHTADRIGRDGHPP